MKPARAHGLGPLLALGGLFPLVALVAGVGAAGCGSNDLTLHYVLDGLAPADVIRVETRVDVDPSDSRVFFADQPFRQVAIGIGYEVRDVDSTGRRTLLITHDATLGYVFQPTFDFRLLPPIGSGTSPPLAIVARAVGTSDMIGQTTPLGGAFGHDARLVVDLPDQRCGGQSCDANKACCSGACTSVQSDGQNCGACGASCAPGGDSCSGETCRCAGGSACTGGATCCSGLGCIDLQTDPFHCGACDHACNPGESCAGGQCQCGSSGAACTGATAVCCSDGTCSATGSCTCGGTTCNFPQVCCGGGCVDVRGDNANCGTCGHACQAPLACATGACACNNAVCAPGDSCCSSGCANTSNDPDNCGSCGHRCDAGETCGVTSPGGTPTCLCGTSVCGPNQLCCGGACVTQGTANCGTCSHACRMGEQCTVGGGGTGSCSCNGGNACVGNQVCCGQNATGGPGCFDVSSGPEHCGACDKPACPSGQMCQMGQCVASQCNPSCSNGNTCNNGVCDCNGGKACTGNQTCCQSGCVDLSSDPSNCGQCKHACTTDPLCCGGTCKPHTNFDCNSCGDKCGVLQTCCPPCSGTDYKCGALCLACPGNPT